MAGSAISIGLIELTELAVCAYFAVTTSASLIATK
jgi:hypothetical protein